MSTANRRILIIDDNRAIHEDFTKILGPGEAPDPKLSALEDELFGETAPSVTKEGFDISSAFQGQDALRHRHGLERWNLPAARRPADSRFAR